jgi:leucyl-tRNA synthetase
LSQEALALRRAAHRRVNRIGSDIESLRFNVAVAQIYELSHLIEAALSSLALDEDASLKWAAREALEYLLKAASPMMPHLAEECWGALGHSSLLADAPWPTVEAELLVDDMVKLAVQVNGKRRGEIAIRVGLPREKIEEAALEHDNVRRAIDGKAIRRIIVEPPAEPRIVNVVTI